MITLKNTPDKQTLYIPKTVVETEFVSGYEAKDVSITRNGAYQIIPSSGKKAISAVKLDVDVKLEGQDKEVMYKENGSYTIKADEGYPGLNTVEVEVDIDTDTYFDRGYAVGAKEQKAKLGTIDITENGSYYKADGYKEINVNVPEVSFNAQSKDVTYTDNGEYTITPDEGYDGLDEVKVNVEVDTSNVPFLVPGDMRFGYSTFEKFPEN